MIPFRQSLFVINPSHYPSLPFDRVGGLSSPWLRILFKVPSIALLSGRAGEVSIFLHYQTLSR